MKQFNLEGRTYNFATDIEVPEKGMFIATLVNESNIRCELIFEDGTLIKVTELD